MDVSSCDMPVFYKEGVCHFKNERVAESVRYAFATECIDFPNESGFRV